MADTTTTKILEVVVDNNKAVTAIAHYNKLIEDQKKLQAELAQKFKDGEITQEAYRKATIKINEENKAYARLAREVSKELQNNIKMEQEQAGSLRALRAELSNVTKQYDALSEADRRSADGLKLKGRIDEITTTLKNSEGETGRFFRNVGDYANKTVEAFTRLGGSMGNMKGPINAVNNGFKMLSGNAIIVVLGALVKIIQSVIQNLKSSEETMNAVAVAMAPLNAGGRLLTRVMQALGNGLAKVVTKMTEWADKLGLINEAMKNEQQLVKDNIALELREREVIMQNADSQLKVSQLRAQAADKIKYSAQERIELLKQAMNEEEAIAKREMELAQERYRIQVEQSKLAENSKEENDQLAQSYAAMRQAEQSYYDKTRELQAQIVEATNQIRSEQKAANTERIKGAENELKAMVKANGMTAEQLEKELDIRQREVEARLKLVEEGSLAEYHLRQEQLQAQLDADLRRLASEEGTDSLIKLRREQFLKDMADLDTQWHDAAQAEADALVNEVLEGIWAEEQARREAFEEMKQQELEKQQLAQDTALAFGDVAGSIAGMLQSFGEENKELARLSKVIALAQIAIETGVATAKGISAAMSVPFPANLAAIATTIATIISGMTSAISTVKGAKFASGGYVSGPGTATSDSIPAMLSNGESVINARSTAMFGPLLSGLNQAGGGIAFNPAQGGAREGFEYLAAAVASGMKHAKLSVAVDEVKRVEDRVGHINEVSTIGRKP